MQLTIQVQVCFDHPDFAAPVYATAGSVGMDLQAAILDPILLHPLERQMVPCGIKIAIPEGFEGQVRPRSGLSAKHGVTTIPSPGTIDSDYRGEVSACLINLGATPQVVKPLDRIAQLVVSPVLRVKWEPVETLKGTVRGEGGFGSTGG